ncbi:MAG TPA: chromosome segregation protein SMC, partial [Steroidobacteraceae bacterium]|nr:chromosome segregation protein SMC [Steroidobacteraceae bacterium]
RASEAAIEKQREFYAELSDALSRVQTRYYEMGAAVTRTEQALAHSRQLRERALQEHAQLGTQLAGIAEQALRDEQQLVALRSEIGELTPQLAARRDQERRAAEAQAAQEAQLAAWQERWEAFNRELGAVAQSGEVEAARIEQLENQRLRLQAHADRLSVEAETLATQAADPVLEGLQQREASGREAAEQLAGALAGALENVQRLRAAQQSIEGRLEQLRRERDQTRSELLSLEALQKAALQEQHPASAAWLASLGERAGLRLAEILEVDPGWERAVETVLGDYLEAVDVDTLEPLQSELGRLSIGQLTFIERSSAEASRLRGAGTLAAHVRGPDAVSRLLAHVRTASSLGEALQQRAALAEAESLVTASGEWLARGWLRVNRGGDVHAGVIEREHRLKELREGCALAERSFSELEQELQRVRTQLAGAEQHRDQTQQRIQQAQREHADSHARLEALRARLEQAAQRRQRLEVEQAEVHADAARTAESLARAQAAYDEANTSLARLDEQRLELASERELRRADTASARERAQAAQLELRDAMVRLESRRSAEASMVTALQRLQQQHAELLTQRERLQDTLRDAEAPIADLEQQLQEHLSHRLDAEGELSGARRALEDCDQRLRALEQRRMAAEQRVEQARSGAEQVRLAVQEARLRREALLEQFAATQCELPAVLANLDPQADLGAWEQRLATLRSDIERLGQVNLAAISELAEQSERKSYLDRQFTDVSEALETLEQAMRRIDRETRTRFEDTFNRINAGLKEKFPTLFGGGHAYLELVGEDPLAAGVTVMARPPGKRNSTIAQLSGGEKALTAVALVFAIFDLNPAPFCLLDEVDAPLDEHNVGRFCDIVRAMSNRIQFIFITHNKVTMELASQLVGVTMSEAGVSRLVTVDIDEAVKLAAV